MKDDEIVHFIVIFFSLGMVFHSYFNGLFQSILLIIAFVGALYFILGVLSRIISGLSDYEVVWAKDWWHGLAILVLVGLVFGRMDLAINATYSIIDIGLKLLVKLLTLSI